MKGSIPSLTALALAAALCAPAAAQPPECTGPSVESYLDCAKRCQEEFYVSEHTGPAFAELRATCLVGCGRVPDDAVAPYTRCFKSCKTLFPYRHGMEPYFADVQAGCVEGCRGVR